MSESPTKRMVWPEERFRKSARPRATRWQGSFHRDTPSRFDIPSRGEQPTSRPRSVFASSLSMRKVPDAQVEHGGRPSQVWQMSLLVTRFGSSLDVHSCERSSEERKRRPGCKTRDCYGLEKVRVWQCLNAQGPTEAAHQATCSREWRLRACHFSS